MKPGQLSGIVLSYKLDDWEFQAQQGLGIFLFTTASGAHPASYPMGTGRCYLRLKRPGREADHSPPSSAEVKNAWYSVKAPSHEGVLSEWRYSSTHSLTSALDGGEWSASRPGRFTPRERAPGTHWIGKHRIWSEVSKDVAADTRIESQSSNFVSDQWIGWALRLAVTWKWADEGRLTI
jgi:hypothetical protein